MSKNWALVVALLCGASTPCWTDRAVRPYFSPGIAKPVVQELSTAKKTIDIALYYISTRGDIFKALQAAAGRGVTVRIILHDADGKRQLRNSEKLEAAGIDIRHVTPTMHQYLQKEANTTHLRFKVFMPDTRTADQGRVGYLETSINHDRDETGDGPTQSFRQLTSSPSASTGVAKLPAESFFQLRGMRGLSEGDFELEERREPDNPFHGNVLFHTNLPKHVIQLLAATMALNLGAPCDILPR